MRTRTFLLIVATFALVGLTGCSAPDPLIPESAPLPAPEEQPSPKTTPPVSTAPAPRAKGEPVPHAEAVVSRSSKPWSELIIGKWIQVKHHFWGDNSVECTRDGRYIRRYSYAARGNHPKGIEGSTQKYQLNGNVLFPHSTFDDGVTVLESTTFVETLTEGEMVLLTKYRSRWSLEAAKNEADQRKVPLNLVLNEYFKEEQGRASFVRAKDRDK